MAKSKLWLNCLRPHFFHAADGSMEQTEKFSGLSLDQIAVLAQSDPKLMKDVVPMGVGGIIKIAAAFFIFWILASAYSYLTSPRTFSASAFFAYTMVGLVVLVFVAGLAYKRRTLKGRLDMGSFAPLLELKYDASKLLSITIDPVSYSPTSWKYSSGLSISGSVPIASLRFVDYASGHSGLLVKMRSGYLRSRPS